MKAVDLLRPAQLTLLILLAAIGPMIVMRGTGPAVLALAVALAGAGLAS